MHQLLLQAALRAALLATLRNTLQVIIQVLLGAEQEWSRLTAATISPTNRLYA